jgi:hypothetical protein
MNRSVGNLNYSWPGDYPLDCPPDDCDEGCGKYYRILTNPDRTDPNHYKSYYDLKRGNDVNTCGRRALSLRMTREQAKALIDIVGERIGRYIICLNLRGNHGLVKITNLVKGHCNWWIPLGVNPVDFCEGEVEGPL